MTARVRLALVSAAAGLAFAAATVPGDAAAVPYVIPGIKPRSVTLVPYGGYHLFLQQEENFANTGVFGLRIGVNPDSVLGFEVGVGYLQTVTHVELNPDKDGKLTHVLNPRLDLTFHLTKWPVVPYLQVGAGFKYFNITNRPSESQIVVSGGDYGDVLPQPKNPDIDFEIDAALGARILFVSRFGLDVNARYLMSFGSGETFTNADETATYEDRFDNLEFTIGVLGVVGGPPDDRDLDSIIDRLDACRDDPEDFDKWMDEDGCPEWDNDHDGIRDTEDRCPDVAEDADGFQDADGCPDEDDDRDGILDVEDRCRTQPEDFDGFDDDDGCPELDNDGDGIADPDDKCPNLPENFNGVQDEDGCPDKGDRDGDGILDPDDRCPDQPEDPDDFEDVDGCPDHDNDGDGVLDGRDTCPNHPETPNGYQDTDGCPDEIPEDLTRFIGVIQGIYFKLNSDEIKRESFVLLDQAAEVLVRYPQIRLEIQGHASADGDDDANMDLSQRRAESVMRHLVRGGVDPGRLVAVGFGETKPIAEDTPDGRVLNRRVEFHILPPEKPARREDATGEGE